MKPKINEIKSIEEFTDLNLTEKQIGDLKEIIEKNYDNCEIIDFEKRKSTSYVGIIWADPNLDNIIRITPKIKTIDYINIFLCCINNPIVSAHLDKCFEFFMDDESIDLDEECEEFLLFVIFKYINELYNLLRKFIRNKFYYIEENLNGKIKGKILVEKQIRKNQLRFQPQKIFCKYQIFNKNCIENQILKTALVRSIKYINSSPNFEKYFDLIFPKINFSNRYLMDVETKKIYPQDFTMAFSQVKGFYMNYRTPLNLAKIILRCLGLDPDAKIDKSYSIVYPYYIDMNELFERYCEVQLRESYPNSSKFYAGYQDKNRNLGKGKIKVRPDFLMINKEEDRYIKYIIDSKYKPNWDFDQDDKKKDVYQVISYSRHKGVIDEFKSLLNNDNFNDDPNSYKIFILYPPAENKNENLKLLLEWKNISNDDKCDSFEIDIFRKAIQLPIKGI